MTVYVDSADLEDVETAFGLGFVTGVTTNPTLMRMVTDDPLKHAARMLSVVDCEEFFYQPTGAYDSMLDEALAAHELAPERVILKIPVASSWLPIAAKLRTRGVRVALTAAQMPTAMIVAEAAGCEAVIPYLDRAWRDERTENYLVKALVRVRRGDTRIIAASVKNVGQFVEAFADGADRVSAPLAVLGRLLSHPAVLEAEQAFLEEYRG